MNNEIIRHHTLKVRAKHEDVSTFTRRSFLVPSAVGGALLLLLLAVASYAQTVFKLSRI